jgi:hypothetical protein
LGKLSSKMTLNYGQFEATIKQVAGSSFTEAINLPDKIRIFFMHIRNPCKLHYQVCLNFL